MQVLSAGLKGRVWRPILACATIAVALLVLAASAHATFPGKNGKIAFESGRAEPNPLTCELSGPHVCNTDIYTVNPDGTDLTRLTSDPAPERDATWSPDGKKIAFIRFSGNPSECGSCGEVYVMNADGSDQTNLTSKYGLHAYSVTWSPSGDVAFVYLQSGGYFATVPPDGTNLTTLFTLNNLPSCRTSGFVCFANDFTWSPDGQEIAFDGFSECVVEDCFTDEESWIQTIKPDGSGATILREEVRDPDWSPDSAQIVFDSIFFGDPDGVMDRNGNLVRTYDISGGAPVWSPDGKQIAFGDVSGLFRMNADGSGKTQITTSTRPPGARFLDGDGRPDWQPIPEPQRSDYKNAAKFCEADREFLGDSAFTNKYGGGANAYGKCVSQSH